MNVLQFRSTPSAHHLSDDQLDDHLIGDLAPEPAAHLAACTHCTDRLAAAAAPIATFESVTMAWSERRSATLPLPDLSAVRPLWQRHMTTAMACFTFAIGFALINANHPFAPTDTQPISHEAATAHIAFPTPVFTHANGVHTAHPQAQLAADNQMLQAVDTELQPDADNPSALGLEPVSNNAAQPRSTVSVQD